MSQYVDGFASLDSTKWAVWNSTVSAGTLRQNLDVNYGQLDSWEYYDLTEGYVQAKLAALPATGVGTDVAISLCFDVAFRDVSGNNFTSNNRVYLAVSNFGSGITTKAVQKINGVQATAWEAAYNAGTDVWLRIRISDRVIYYETSADGTNWSVRYSNPIFYSPKRCMVEITAGDYDSGASQGVVQWDDCTVQYLTDDEWIVEWRKDTAGTCQIPSHNHYPITLGETAGGRPAPAKY